MVKTNKIKRVLEARRSGKTIDPEVLTKRKEFCPECGTKNSDDAIFCLECGTKLKSITPKEKTIKKSTKEKKEITKLRKGSHKCFLSTKYGSINSKSGKISVNDDGLIFNSKDGTIIIKWYEIIDVSYSRSSNKTFIEAPHRDTFIFTAFLNPLKMKSDTTYGIYLITKKNMNYVNLWDRINENDAIQKITTTKSFFYTEISKEIQQSPKMVIKDNSGPKVGATLLGGFLLGPVGALAGYAATKGRTEIIETSPTEKTLKLNISLNISVHEKGIKIIKKDKEEWNTQIDPDNKGIMKIPWNKIIDVNHTHESITITLVEQEILTLKGDLTALKGLYLITKDSMTGRVEEVEEEEGWN